MAGEDVGAEDGDGLLAGEDLFWVNVGGERLVASVVPGQWYPGVRVLDRFADHNVIASGALDLYLMDRRNSTNA